MNNLRKILSQFAGKNLIAVPTILVELTGDWTMAVMLNQLLYWSGKGSRTDGYIYKSMNDWQEEIKIVSDYSIRKFKKLPYIETKIKKVGGTPTTHYKINYDILLKELGNIDSELLNSTIQNVENDDSINREYLQLIKTDESVLPESEKTTNREDHQLMIEALMKLTKMDMKIKSNAGRIARASKELRLAGYKPNDVAEFGKYWKNDWRWKANKEPPTLNIILTDIGKMKNLKPDIKKEVNEKLDRAKEIIRRTKNG